MIPEKLKKIPALANLLLKRMSIYDERHSIRDDFEETFNEICREKSVLKAKYWCWQNVFKSFIVYLNFRIYWSFIMFKNYLKASFRNMKRQKFYSLINITGLAVGMACSILILIWVIYEFSFDRFHKNFHDIYRITSKYLSITGEIFHMTFNPYPLAEILKDQYPEVINYARCINPPYTNRVETEHLVDHKNIFAFVDPSFFEVFTFPLLKGDPKSLFNDKYSVVITEGTAERYFADSNPIGKTMFLFNSKTPFKVTGIVKNVPKNSHIKYEFLLNTEHEKNWTRGSFGWKTNISGTYLQLKKKFNKSEFEQKILSIIKRHNLNRYKKIILQPLSDIHLKSGFDSDLPNFDRGNIKDIILFLTLSILVLIIACINFMSLSTANSVKRSKEVGVRKVIGARRNDLIKQFFSETMIFAFTALFFALILVYLFLPKLRQLSGRELDLGLLNKNSLIFAVFIVTILTGFFSGSYPALFLSSFKPVTLLKNVFSAGKKSCINFRNSLVTIQYVFSIILIIGTIVIFSQLKYINSKDLGFEKENLITLYPPYMFDNKRDIFKEELLKDPNILNISFGFIPRRDEYGHRVRSIDWEGKSPDLDMNMDYFPADYDYLKTFGIELIDGRFFSREHLADTANFVLNETAVNVMGIQNPIGKRISVNGKEGEIIGVVKDFHISSLKVKLNPFLFVFSNRYWAIIKVDPKNLSETIEYLEKVWKEFIPERQFEYKFMDDELNAMYRNENKVFSILKLFTLLVLAVFCLGLVGLVSFSTEQRTREIGIRKVFGAKIGEIVALIYREFILLLIIALIIACPIGYYILNMWLQNFVYKIGLSWWIFALSGVIVLVISLFTVSFKTIKAAHANPVDSLRYE